jgi:hypothetical protein
MNAVIWTKGFKDINHQDLEALEGDMQCLTLMIIIIIIIWHFSTVG